MYEFFSTFLWYCEESYLEQTFLSISSCLQMTLYVKNSLISLSESKDIYQKNQNLNSLIVVQQKLKNLVRLF